MEFVIYQVVHSPDEGGVVNTIRQLQIWKGTESASFSVEGCVQKEVLPVDQPAGVVWNQEDPQEYEEADDVDLVALVSETPRAIQGMGSRDVGRSVQPEVQELLPAGLPLVGTVLVESEEWGVGLIVRESEAPPGPHNERVVTPRRSGRAGAGQHSNLHRLPRAVGEVMNSVTDNCEIVSNTISALFRPWS